MTSLSKNKMKNKNNKYNNSLNKNMTLQMMKTKEFLKNFKLLFSKDLLK
jgi:hypothetical protein